MGQAESKDSETRPHSHRGERRFMNGGDRSKRATPPIANATTQSQRPSTAGNSRVRSSSGTSRPGPNTVPRALPKARPLSGGRPRMTAFTQQQTQASPVLRNRPRIKQQLAMRSKPITKEEEALQTREPEPVLNPGDNPIHSTPHPMLDSKPARSEPIPITRPPNRGHSGRYRSRTQPRRSAPLSRGPGTSQTTSDDPEEKSPPAKRVTRRSAQKLESVSIAGKEDTIISDFTPSIEIGNPFSQEKTVNKAASPDISESDDETDSDVDGDDDDSDTQSDDSENIGDGIDDLTEQISGVVEPVASVQPVDSEESVEGERAPVPVEVGATGASVRRSARSSHRPATGDAAVREPASAATTVAAVKEEFHLRRSRRRSVPVRRLQVDPHRMVYISV